MRFMRRDYNNQPQLIETYVTTGELHPATTIRRPSTGYMLGYRLPR